MHITYTKKNMTNIEEYNIDVTVGNVQKIKCELKVTVNMKLQGGEAAKMTKVLCIRQAIKNILSISRLISKRAILRTTKDKTTTKKIGFNMILDARKGRNKSTVL